MESVIATDDLRGRRRFPWAMLACVVLVLAGLAAYSDSFNGPFIFDDTIFVDRPSAEHLWPIGPILAAPRPVVEVTLAFNCTVGGGVRGYHIFNVVVHLLAALALFGVMRRTLKLPRLAGWFSEGSATALAFCTALLWTLHPLQTEAVTYVIQRMESLAALFYLTALYCLIRGADNSTTETHPGTATCRAVAGGNARLEKREEDVRRAAHVRAFLWSGPSFWWYAATVAACALGMGCKEIMVTAPPLLLLYDRIFISGSFRETLRRRWLLHVGLLATEFLLAGSVLQAFAKNPLSAGFALASITPLQYAQSQMGVILHYLVLVFRPTGLCLDYNWPVAKGLADILPGAIVIGTLLVATVAALILRPMWGFAGAWFFLILAPTSSFLPIRDLAFEHRMYLPLAAIAAAAVVAVYLLGERLARRLGEPETERRFTAGLLALALTISASAMLGALTWRRNAQYQTGIAIWQDTVNKAKDNPRAWNNLADAWLDAGDYTKVLGYCDEAIRLKPNFPEPYNNRGLWYSKQGQYEEAVDNYSLAIEMRENFPMAYNNRASAHIHLGQYEEAIRDCLRAVELDPQMAMAYYNLGNAYSKSGDDAEAVTAYQKAIELRWNYAETYYNLASALQRVGRREEALRNYDKAIQMSPDYSDAYFDRANLRVIAHDLAGAIRDFDMVIRLKPEYAEAYFRRGNASVSAGQYAAALQDFDVVIRLKPDYAAAYNNRGNARLTVRQYAEAARDFDRALELKHDQPETYKSLAVAHYFLKEYDKAWADVEACEKLGGRPAPDFIRTLSRDSGRSR